MAKGQPLQRWVRSSAWRQSLLGAVLSVLVPITAAAQVPLDVLHAFTGGTDPHRPGAALIQASDRHLYGTTTAGGAAGAGTTFRMSLGGTVTVLHEFGGGAAGARPQAALLEGSDGNFYGTTTDGGSAGHGTIFRMTPAGHVTILHSFTGGSDGSKPRNVAMIEATDGNFYGRTRTSVFRMSRAGIVTSGTLP